MTRRVNFVRSKDAQKQLAQTSLSGKTFSVSDFLSLKILEKYFLYEDCWQQNTIKTMLNWVVL